MQVLDHSPRLHNAEPRFSVSRRELRYVQGRLQTMHCCGRANAAGDDAPAAEGALNAGGRSWLPVTLGADGRTAVAPTQPVTKHRLRLPGLFRLPPAASS